MWAAWQFAPVYVAFRPTDGEQVMEDYEQGTGSLAKFTAGWVRE